MGRSGTFAASVLQLPLKPRDVEPGTLAADPAVGEVEDVQEAHRRASSVAIDAEHAAPTTVAWRIDSSTTWDSPCHRRTGSKRSIRSAVSRPR
jgi:hypothetical protein